MGRWSTVLRQIWRGSARTNPPIDEDYFIFHASTGDDSFDSLPDHYSVRTWQPGLTSIIPPTFGLRRAAFWLFHYCRVFRNRDYKVLYIEEAGKVVHCTCIVPKYFRWPFMQDHDIQISSMWTDEAHRGKGLASFAVQHVLASNTMKVRRIWFAARENNPASLSVCRKCGFELVGVARRVNRFGTRILGTLSMQTAGPRSFRLPKSFLHRSASKESRT